MWPGPTQRTPTGQYPADVPVAERLPAQHTFDFLHSPFSGSPSCWCVSPPSGWSAPPSQRSCSSPGSSATCRSTASSPTSSRWKPPITTARRTPESDALPVFSFRLLSRENNGITKWSRRSVFRIQNPAGILFSRFLTSHSETIRGKTKWRPVQE